MRFREYEEREVSRSEPRNFKRVAPIYPYKSDLESHPTTDAIVAISPTFLILLACSALVLITATSPVTSPATTSGSTTSNSTASPPAASPPAASILAASTPAAPILAASTPAAPILAAPILAASTPAASSPAEAMSVAT